MKRHIKACGYIRVSSDEDIGIPAQRERLDDLAVRHGYEVVQWYIDEGRAGIDADRHGWRSLLADAATAEWEMVLCLNRERFNRLSSIEQGMVLQALKKAGKKLHTAVEGPVEWDASAGEIIDTMIKAQMSECHSAQCARRSLQGQLRAFQEGRRIPGTCPYGYACVVTDPNGNTHRLSRKENSAVPKGWTKKLVPGDPDEIEVVQWLFHTYAATDASITSLANKLNAKGVPAPRGDEWLGSTVVFLLANDTYVGDTRFGRRSTGKYARVDNGKVVWIEQHITDDERKETVRQNTHEGIISRDLWDAVQKKLQRRAKK